MHFYIYGPFVKSLMWCIDIKYQMKCNVKSVSGSLNTMARLRSSQIRCFQDAFYYTAGLTGILGLGMA